MIQMSKNFEEGKVSWFSFAFLAMLTMTFFVTVAPIPDERFFPGWLFYIIVASYVIGMGVAVVGLFMEVQMPNVLHRVLGPLSVAIYVSKAASVFFSAWLLDEGDLAVEGLPLLLLAVSHLVWHADQSIEPSP